MSTTSSLIDLLHILLCQQHHVYDMLQYSARKEGHCYFYLENDIASGDTMQDHLEWESIKDNFKSSLDLRSDEEALRFVKEVITLSQNLKKLLDSSPQREAFVKTLLF